MRRMKRAIPAVTMVSLSGCGLFGSDPLVGDWELSRIDDVSLPLQYAGPYCTYRLSGEMEIESDLEGFFSLRYRYECPGYGTYDYTYNCPASADKTARREYDIRLRGDCDLRLRCELDSDTLDCRDRDDDIRVRFRRD